MAETRYKAVVVFDTMWQSTAKMARAVGEGLMQGGATPVEIMPLSSKHRSDVATAILDAGALLVGSPTMNNQLFPSVADILTYLAGLRPRHLVGAAFGSYGWADTAVKRLKEAMAEMKFEPVGDGISVQYRPTEEDLERARAFGNELGAAATAS